MIILINEINELTKKIINSKNKIIINSDFINLNLVESKLKKLNLKYKILSKSFYIEDKIFTSVNFCIKCNNCYIIYDDNFIGYKKDKAENKEKTLKELENIAKNYNVKMGLTIGKLSKNIFDKISNINIKIDKYILTRLLNAYNGGVIMQPKKSNHKNIIEYDMRSAYPFQLIDKKYMLGEFYIYNKPVSEIYIINFSIKKYKLKNNVYDILENIKSIKQNNKIYYTITSIEFEYLIKHYELINLQIYYYINSTKINYLNDGNFVKTFYKIKLNAKNETEKTTAKLILNSLLGKLAQRKYFYERDIREDTLILSILANAYQRIEITKIINKYINNIVYADTDGIFTNKEIKEIKINKEIGRWKKEKEINKLKLLNKRVYIADDDQHIAGLSTNLNKNQIKKIHKMKEKEIIIIENKNKRNESLGLYTLVNQIKEN